MAKQKTHSSSKKRFKVSGTGLIVRSRAGKKHKLTHKTAKRKRDLRGTTVASPGDAAVVRQMIPYKKA
ncbi:MAG: 50S ribosomal protein L35 [Clostridiaceae bacterium]|nr:50S ribosomal protein L35 [Clostridiaceae bacterium]NLZ70769.1 50S ribosomal protein L35 [Clostridiaceae bacterium]